MTQSAESFITDVRQGGNRTTANPEQDMNLSNSTTVESVSEQKMSNHIEITFLPNLQLTSEKIRQKYKKLRHMKGSKNLQNMGKIKCLISSRQMKAMMVCSARKGFSRRSTLTKHHRIHSVEKLCKCDQCDKVFPQSYYAVHLRVHTGEKPYQCDQCDKAFTQKSALNVHLRIHSGEKPYRCVECDKTFAQKANLAQHIGIHSGEKN